jgi:DNA replication initiation complex subunit (GINS family)
VYNDLYAAWIREISEASLGGLPPDFYARITEYMKRINQEDALLEKKSVKVSLLEHEAQNAKRMLEELLKLRYQKIINAVTELQKVPSELLTVEEAKMCERFLSFTDNYQRFSESLMQGQATLKFETATAPYSVPQVANKRLTIRFSKSIPAIMGADLKSYGPFAVEDVASLPADNAKILVKQGLAVLVDVS